uniref:Reverse transcriptase domain-containing protein n=1 Tax=Pygocentrus nattereri TaxID=42514 RepID=A0AAR2KBY1_PYGNA
MLSRILIDFDYVLITGDFNIHMDIPTNPVTSEFMRMLNSFGLTQHVSGPTHRHGHTLDLIISKRIDVNNTEITDVAISDHFGVFFNMSLSIRTLCEKRTITKRYLSAGSAVAFTDMIQSLPPLSENANELVETFIHRVRSCIDVVAPKVTKTISGRIKMPWRNTTSIIKLRQDCRQAERRWRRSKLVVHFDIYKTTLQTYNSEVKSARKNYYSTLIDSTSNNSAALFRSIDRLVNPTSHVFPESVSVEKCDEFAIFFRDKITNLRQNIATSTNRLPALISVSHPNCNMSYFKEVDMVTLFDVISSLKSSTCELDPLPTCFFKQVLSSLSNEVLMIVNQSLQLGEFPNILKTAVVKPLLKNRNLDPTFLNNYRPISNLPFLSKIIEKVVSTQLNDYVKVNQINDTFQSGFRALHSTETALVRVVNDLRLNKDAGKLSVLFLLDLSAAFDTVDHEILIDRLQSWVGLSGLVLDWFRSYLTGRDYYVALGTSSSTRQKITCGVPQGSILGPLLFNLYMLPLPHIINKHGISYHQYADDTQLYISLEPKALKSISTLFECIGDIQTWMSDNFLQLNKEKTEVLVIGSDSQKNDVQTYLNQMNLKAKQCVKNLGVTFDNELSFKSHIMTTCKTAYFHLRNIAKVRDMLSPADSEKLVHAFITSRLDYCNAVLSALPKSSISHLQRVQNAAARVLTRRRKRDHITPALHSLHWLPVSFRIDFKVLVMVFKCLHGLAPLYLSEMMVRYVPVRSL